MTSLYCDDFAVIVEVVLKMSGSDIKKRYSNEYPL